MKFAPMNYHYLRYPIKKFLDKVERSPFNSIDLYCSAPQLNLFDYPLSRLIELKKEIEAHHLSVMAMTPENCVYPVNFCTQDDLTRESSIRYYQRAIDTAQFLDCPCVQISTGFGYFDQPREEGWKYCRESLWTLAQYCEKKDVRLLLEELKVTTTNVLITSKDIAKMLEEIDSPAIVGMVDMDQMTYAKETIDDYFDNLGDKLQRGEQLEHFTSLGVALSVMCRNPLLEYGAKALEDHKKGLCTYDVEQVVLAIVVTTGIASIFLTKDFTPDYNSGLAHAIFYALTSYPVIEEKHLHGEVVGFGVLFALLVDEQYEEFEKIYCLNKKLQLPTSLSQIEITEEQWAESINRIPEMSDIRHYPYKVTPEMLTRAMQQLKEREAKG